MGITNRDVLANLSRDDVVRLRKTVEEKLIQVHKSGKNIRLELPDDILEAVLFDFYDGYKKIGFISDYLRYLDLSNASFASVLYTKSNSGEVVNLSNTNARINFDYACGSHEGEIVISGFNFENVDLSCNDFDKIKLWRDRARTNRSKEKDNDFEETKIKFKNCNLSNTNLKITNYNDMYFSKCDLSNNDLSNLVLTVFDVCPKLPININKYYNFYECNFENTGVRFFYSIDQVREKHIDLNKFLKDPRFKGCYISRGYGDEFQKIDDKISKKISNERILSKYESGVIDLFEDVYNGLEEQLEENEVKESADMAIYDRVNKCFVPMLKQPSKKANSNKEPKKLRKTIRYDQTEQFNIDTDNFYGAN